MKIALIVAAAGKNQVIGKNGDMPWHFSADLKFFKETTLNHDVLMGRTTYESVLRALGKPLPKRRNIVLTSNSSFHDDRVTIIHNLAELKNTVAENETLFVTGGAQVYAQMLPMADMVYLTHIDAEIEGDAFFPLLNPKDWQVTETARLTENDILLRFCTYKRV